MWMRAGAKMRQIKCQDTKFKEVLMPKKNLK